MSLFLRQIILYILIPKEKKRIEFPFHYRCSGFFGVLDSSTSILYMRTNVFCWLLLISFSPPQGIKLTTNIYIYIYSACNLAMVKDIHGDIIPVYNGEGKIKLCMPRLLCNGCDVTTKIGINHLPHSYAWDIIFIPLANFISTSASPWWILSCGINDFANSFLFFMKMNRLVRLDGISSHRLVKLCFTFGLYRISVVSHWW